MGLFKKLAVVAAFAASIGSAGAATAFGDGGVQLQNAINSLYHSASCPTCSPVSAAPDVNTDQYGLDEVWRIEASGGSVATIVLEFGAFAPDNIMGIYDANDASKKVSVFPGAAANPDRATISISPTGQVVVTLVDLDAGGSIIGSVTNFTPDGFFSGSNFGFYLTTQQQNTFYSQKALNPNGDDQMVAYRGDGDTIKIPGVNPGVWGPSSFILAWEDLVYATGDKNFTDMMVYVESLTGVPEPGTLALLGLSLAGLGVASRRRRSA